MIFFRIVVSVVLLQLFIAQATAQIHGTNLGEIDETGVVQLQGSEIFFLPDNEGAEKIVIQPYSFPSELHEKRVRIRGRARLYEGYPNKVISDPRVSVLKYENFDEPNENSINFEASRHKINDERSNISEITLYSSPLPSSEDLISGLANTINPILKKTISGPDRHDPYSYTYDNRAFSGILSPPTNRQSIDFQYERFREGLVSNLNSENEQEVAKLLGFWANDTNNIVAKYLDYENESVFKSIYDFDDSFPSFRLNTMNLQTDSVGGLYNKTGGRPKPICSVSKVSHDLVITAAHCLKERLDISKYKVVFNLKDNADGTVSDYVSHNVTGIVGADHRKLSDIRKGPYSATNLDYVLLSFDNPQFSATRNSTCMDKSAVRKGAMVYSIGHSSGEGQKFHSNGRVFIPYEISEEFFDDNLVSIATDEFDSIVRRIKAPSADVITEDIDLAQENLGNTIIKIATQKAIRVFKELQKSYTNPIDESSWYYLASNEGLDKMPVMGISLDLHKGDSGAPIFSLDGQQCLVGILSSGANDGVKGIVVNYDYHEKVVPIKAITEDLKKSTDNRILELLQKIQ